VIDHLVYATSDLARSVDDLASRLGVRATVGGQHPGRGTRNALLALGPTTYLELIGPDPEQPDPPSPRWLGVDEITTPRLVTWAAVTTNIAARRDAARRAGIPLGPVRDGERRRTDGVLVRWSLTEPATLLDDGLLPFLIDWGDSPHPAATAAAGLRLRSLRAEHPNAASVSTRLRAMGLSLPVRTEIAPALIAELDTPYGVIELR
jgi:hypothetical protein